MEKTSKPILLGKFQDYCDLQLVQTTQIYLMEDELWIHTRDEIAEQTSMVSIDAIHFELLADCLITACTMLENQLP